ncbi:MAG TPA: hypothetical protein VM818_24670 [Vicinamibacterales bacterium]|nr:hypothetical protein [Vicinamibacterales bacterium]
MIAYILTAALACDPLLTALFTPPRPSLGRYEICTTLEPLEVVADAADGHLYGSVETLGPLDAFGAAGTYDRLKLARLYAETGVRVVRGWRIRGNDFESVTLLSPYPDAGLTRLVPGTMVIRFVLPAR